MRFEILTLFPEFFDSPLRQSIIGRAVSGGLLDISVRNIRDYTTDKHRTTDDYPYGGGAGMVMKVEPVARALEAVGKGKVILTTPQGARLTQGLAKGLSAEERLVIICGRYEGVDERIRGFADLEVSIGDYVLTGGEIAALAIIDAVGRLVPGVLGDEQSAVQESFSEGLLEYPHYTRPEEFRGMRVPEVLLSGNHKEIERWRRQEALRRTYLRRPDLLEGASLTDEDKRFIAKLKGG